MKLWPWLVILAALPLSARADVRYCPPNPYDILSCGVTTDAVLIVQSQDVALPRRPALNFVGAGVTCVDNPSFNRSDCTITGGGGGGGGGGTVTNSTTLTANRFILGNGGVSVKEAPALTGLVLGNGASAPSAYGGTACTNQFVRGLSAAGAATCNTVALATDVSGTLQAAQFPALTGHVTTSAGSVATTIGAGVVTNSMVADVAATKLTGTLQAAQFPALTGDVTTSAGSVATTIAAGAVTNSKVNDVAATKLTGTLQAAQFPALTGPVTTSAGSLATSVTAGSITNAMLAGNIDLAAKVTGVLPMGNGGTGLSTAPDDTVLTGAGGFWQARSLPNCPDTGGNHLNYDIATNAWSCGTSTSGITAVTALGTLPADELIVGNGGTQIKTAVMPVVFRASDSSIQASIVATQGAVAYPELQAGLSGAGATVAATSAIDTDVPLGLVGQGAGCVNLGNGDYATPIVQACSTAVMIGNVPFRPTPMTTAERDALSSPAAGWVVYNTSTNVLNFHNGSTWGAVGGGPGGSNLQVQWNNAGAFAGLGGLSTDGSGGVYTNANVFHIYDNGDDTKRIKFDPAGLVGTKTFAVPNANTTLVGTDTTQTLTNKSISSGQITASATSRLLGRATAGAGAVEELTIGSGLSLSGTTLSASGGGGGDLLSTLTSAEISITGATTATISRMHVCSGTTSDYTVTLPTASGNAGKLIGFRMATGLTKMVTLDGDGSETIDGATTRLLWAGESAILLSDGTNWSKIAGKTIPLSAAMSLSATQDLADSVDERIDFDTTQWDSASMADTTNKRLNIKRGGRYQYHMVTRFTNNSFGVECYLSFRLNGAGSPMAFTQKGANTANTASQTNGTLSVAAGDYLEGWVVEYGAARTMDNLTTLVVLTEVPTW